MTTLTDDERYMRMALDEAHRALARDEVPIGAVIVGGGRVVGRGHNLTETLTDVTAHAEMQAITAAAGSAITPITSTLSTKRRWCRVVCLPMHVANS